MSFSYRVAEIGKSKVLGPNLVQMDMTQLIRQKMLIVVPIDGSLTHKRKEYFEVHSWILKLLYESSKEGIKLYKKKKKKKKRR